VGRCHEADRRDEIVQPVGPMLKTTNLRKLIDRLLASKCETVKIGTDVHARDVVVCLQLDGAMPERPQKTDADQLVGLVTALVKAGRKVHVCQEAGPCGYGLHRRLLHAGAASLVVMPTVLADGRRQKTDGLDATALTDKLDRYVRGNTKAFTVVTVPTPAQEQDRARGRLREQLKHSRHAWEARGRSLLLAQGHHVTGPWWRPSRWATLHAELPAWLGVELEIMRTVITNLDTQEKARRVELEAAAPQPLPKAIGALTWVLLAREICHWARFQNRRQVASYTGLCPGGHQSGGTKRDGHINRHGNPRVRHLLIELVWRLVRWQPAYPPVRQLVEGVVKGAARRKLAVAAARKLAIDLWRLATKQTTPENLHLILPAV
jgi:transposase